MWLTPHTLVGIVVVSEIKDPVISLPLALLSHYVIDFLPHWTQKPSFVGKKIIPIAIDFLLGLGLGLFFAFREPFLSLRFWVIIAGAFLACLPDALNIPHVVSGMKSGLIYKIHDFVDQDLNNDTVYKPLKRMKWIGVVSQAIVVAICLYILFT